jgi:hemerythrin-like domain-containing protein
MAGEDVAAWMKQEHAKVEELAARLRQKTATVPRAGLEQWIVDVRNELEHLRAHLQKHFALEEEGGYLTQVIERRPTLSGEVDRLRSEHSQLAGIMDDMYRSVSTVTPSEELVLRDCCHRIGQFLCYLTEHESRENLIVLSVFTHDIGTKD